MTELTTGCPTHPKPTTTTTPSSMTDGFPFLQSIKSIASTIETQVRSRCSKQRPCSNDCTNLETMNSNWGPSHSMDSEDGLEDEERTGSLTDDEDSPTRRRNNGTAKQVFPLQAFPALDNLDKIWKSAAAAANEIANAASEVVMSDKGMVSSTARESSLASSNDVCNGNPPSIANSLKLVSFMGENTSCVVSPCGLDYGLMMNETRREEKLMEEPKGGLQLHCDDGSVEIVEDARYRTVPDVNCSDPPATIVNHSSTTPAATTSPANTPTTPARIPTPTPPASPNTSSHKSISGAVARRRQRFEQRLSASLDHTKSQTTSPNTTPPQQPPSPTTPQKPPPPPLPPAKPTPTLPFTTLQIPQQHDLERTISELTMKSSYAQQLQKLSDARRMAYYAVGKHNACSKQSKKGNRRCYFTGKSIRTNMPFYAGCVQQGLRTLVVFCLPSALGLPKDEKGEDRTTLEQRADSKTVFESCDESTFVLDDDSSDDDNYTFSQTTTKTLLQRLPEPTQSLLSLMSSRYPHPFSTLPLQVRSPTCWKLYTKFCFFSGLPIAEGELHYRLLVELQTLKEQVLLSHEVMEAVNGEQSAEILRLPNKKTFGYLKKHYGVQSGKLDDNVFMRESWEAVLPEV